MLLCVVCNTYIGASIATILPEGVCAHSRVAQSWAAWLVSSIASIASPCASVPLRASSTAPAVRSSNPSTAPDISPVTLSNRAPAVSLRSEEHTSELQSLMRISYAVFCLKKKKKHQRQTEQSTKHS